MSSFKERKELRKLCQNLAKGNWQKLAEILHKRNEELIEFTAEELCKRIYPIEAEIIEEEDPADNYFFVWMPAFGDRYMTGTGDTLDEALKELIKRKKGLFMYLLERGRRIPDPTEKPQH